MHYSVNLQFRYTNVTAWISVLRKIIYPIQNGASCRKKRRKFFLYRRTNYLLLLILVLIAMGAKDQISYYFLKIDSENEKILNVLAEQNVLSQRITKLSLLIQNDLEFDTIANSRPDSLGRLLPRWK